MFRAGDMQGSLEHALLSVRIGRQRGWRHTERLTGSLGEEGPQLAGCGGAQVHGQGAPSVPGETTLG
jgi:hypothetical protein